MSYYNHPHQSYTPSAPSLPEPYGQQQNHPYQQQQRPSYNYGQQGPEHYRQGQYGNYGAEADVMRRFWMVDRDRSGFIDEFELQEALNYQHHTFHLRTVRLLMFLFKNPNQDSSSRIGPCEFNALWTCLGQWRGIFERFDRDRSGKIDVAELRDALYSIGYAIPPSVLQVLISKYDDGSGRRVELNFDSFVECGMIVKGLTEKFKEKDTRYTGSATLPYDTFMSMIIPFLV